MSTQTASTPTAPTPDAPLMLSVSGLRGIVGKSLTPDLAARYAAAFGQWLKEEHNTATPHVVLGRDSRPSGEMFELAATAGLTSVGCRVTTLGIVTTPSVAIMAEQLDAQGGMVITASHNPIIWNGIKSLRSDGVAPNPDQAAQIIEHFNNDHVTHAAVESLQPVQHNDTTHQTHVDRVLKHIDPAPIRKRKIKVVLDSVHGAGGPAAAMLLDQLGVELVHLYAEPTGLFPHTPEPTRENLVGLCDAVREHGADIGFAQDPDADRLAVVDNLGRYIGEEYTLALVALHALARADCPKSAIVAANLSTSRMIDDIAQEHGARVVRTAVGEANVASAMREHGATIGGEGNGGVIWPKVIHVRDSIGGMALLLEMLAQTNDRLDEIVDRIPHYAIAKEKIDIQPGGLDSGLANLKKHYAEARSGSGEPPHIDTQDGLRIDWEDRWVHVRPSNTEPIARIIAEAKTAGDAGELIGEVRGVMGEG